MTPLLYALLVLSCPATGHAEPKSPSNYDECILEAMRGVSSDVAARAIIDSCRNLYPVSQIEAPLPDAPAADETPPKAALAAAPVTPAPADTTASRSLTADELARLRTRARIFGDAYRVIVNNDNPNLTLTEVTIAVWDDNDPTTSRKEYSEAAQIAPQSSATVKYTVRYRGDEAGWNWGVVAARGVE